MAKNTKHRLIFELSKSERELRLKSALNEVVQFVSKSIGVKQVIHNEIDLIGIG